LLIYITELYYLLNPSFETFWS